MADDVEIIIKDNSKQLATIVNNRIPIILEACGLEAEKYGKKTARVDTGRYRASITHTVSGKGGQVHQYRDDNGKQFTETVVGVPAEEQAVYIGTNVDYALYLEQLDHTIKNAVADHIQEYKKIIKEGLKVE